MKRQSGFEDGVFYWKYIDPIYGTYYFILIAQDDTILGCDKLIAKYNLDFQVDLDIEAKGYCWEHVTKDGKQEIYLGFNKKSTASIQAHEALHAKNFVFKRVGIRPDLDNDEAEAYYVGFVTSMVTLAFADMKKALKKRK